MHRITNSSCLLLLTTLVFAGCGVRIDDDLPIAPAADESAVQSTPSPGWPNFLGPHHDATSHETNWQLDWPNSGPPVLWRKAIGTGYSSPVVVGDDLIIMHRIGDEEIVECLNATSGESKWRFAYPTAYECTYQYSNGPYSTPAINDGYVYARGAEGTLRCIDVATGELRWQRELNRDYDAELGMFPCAGSVFIDEGRIILNVGGRMDQSSVVALDQRTGETVWTAANDGAGDATAVAATIYDRRYLFMFTADGLLALDPSTGNVHWQVPFRARAIDTSNATTPVVVGDKVFITAYKAGALCLRILPDGSYEELWRDRRSLACQFHNLISRDGHVYGFAANDHTLRCVDLETGEVQWKWAAAQGRGQSLLVDDCLITLFETGHLGAIEISPSAHRVRSLSAVPVVSGRCFSSPALAAGRLFLRGEKEIACLRVR